MTKGKSLQKHVSSVPSEWFVTPLGKILNMCQYGISDALTHDGKYAVLRMNNIENGDVITQDIKFANIPKEYFKRFKLEKGDILFNRTNSHDLVGRTGIYREEEDYTFASYLIRLRCNPKYARSEYLNYYLNWYPIQIVIRMLATRGVSQSNINASNLKSLLIALPSHQEQKVIEAILRKIDECLEQTIRVIELLRILKRGLMQYLLTRGIGHTRFKQTKIGEIPESWRIEPLVKLCNSSGEYGAGTSAIEQTDRYPRYVRITDIDETGWLLNETWKSIDPDDATGYILQKGDILFARTGATVGKTYLYREEDGLCAFAGYLIRFRPNSSKLLPEYLFHFTHSSFYYSWVQNIARHTAQPNINAKEYGHMIIPLPPIDEQNKIVSVLSSLDRNIQLELENKNNFEELKKGLMQVLLTGKVRVKIRH